MACRSDPDDRICADVNFVYDIRQFAGQTLNMARDNEEWRLLAPEGALVALLRPKDALTITCTTDQWQVVNVVASAGR